jgi:transposase
MARTAEDRRKYAPAMQEVVRQGMLVRLATTIAMIDPPPPCGRRRIWSTLVMLQALWHLVRDDRTWRRLPGGIGLPPHQRVGSRPLRWRLHEGLERARSVVVACRRLAAGSRRWPRAAIIDTQGNPLGVRIVPADIQDRDALHSLAPDLDRYASLLLVWLDRAFAGQKPPAFLERQGISPEIVGTAGRQGFQIEPRRWKVEQTFACLQRYRRLRVEDETSCETSRHMSILASLFMTGMRLERMHQP